MTEVKTHVPLVVKAAEDDDIDKLKTLLEQEETNVNDFIQHVKQTALHRTCFKEKDNFEIIKLLLKHEANVNAKDCKGCTPLFYAAYYGKEEVVKEFINLKAQINLKSTQGWVKEKIPPGKTAYDMAKLKGHENIANLLKEAT